MLNGIIKKKLTNIINTLISYSITLLWLVGYDFINNYLSDSGLIKCNKDIPLGILIKILVYFLLFLSFLISMSNSKKIKYSLFIIYIIFSSYSLLPDYPYKWLYLSLGTTIFLLVLNNYITLIGEKNSLKFSITNLLFIFLLFILLPVMSFKFKFFLIDFFSFFIVYVFLGNIIVFLFSFIFFKITQKLQ